MVAETYKRELVSEPLRDSTFWVPVLQEKTSWCQNLAGHLFFLPNYLVGTVYLDFNIFRFKYSLKAPSL